MRLLAEAVAEYPAAISIELMNEPPTIDMGALYRLYKACYDAIREVAPDLAVGVADTGSDVLFSNDLYLPADVRAWLRDNSTTHLFYAWHCYGCDAATSARNAVALSAHWGAAPFLTEFGGSDPGGGATG